ncbi:RNA-directed DNA polymerase, eukaryota, reverse transcriptase zinc-binding domain protein [Tanacetum coccineum]|uniref:RNA-directed DNA polymerase, eukaryota, reverse transcriptase zinc-binding domain protein n=1 Tax=Tanacetum coccineum TaxID=301880 RepID=A0ABQ4Z0U9_9ASTR
MARTKSGRMITKDIKRSTTLERSKEYKKDPNDFNLFSPNSHHEDEEVSSNEDVDEWLNAEMSKRMTRQDKKEDEDALIDILKIVVEECKSIYKKAQIKAPSNRTSKIQGISFVTEEEEEESSETLPCQLPPKEINLGSFTLPCTIGNLKLYAMANLGAGVNVMPKSLFEHLKLADLKETSMEVEMADMTKKAPLGIMENILVKIDKFLFYSDFVVINMLEGLNETMLLDRPFLATIHAQIDVLRREILLGIGEYKVKFDMNGGICHSRVPVEKIYMASSIQESKNFNPFEIENDVFSYDSPACLLLDQGTHSYSEEIIDTIDSSHDMQELEGSKDDEVGSHLLENVEWIKENFNFEVDFGRTRDDSYSRRFDVYKEEFDNEIEQLKNEYELKAKRKRYALDEVWEKCEKFHDTTKLWYDKGFEEKELWQNGIEEIDYTHPLVKSETFEVHRYTFKNRKSFISITKQMDDVLTLGRVNGSRFMKKTRKEMDEGMRTTRKT